MKQTLAACLLLILSSQTLRSQSLFYNTNLIQTIELYFPDSAWDYKLDTAKAGMDKELMAKWVRINGVYFDSVGVKYKGSSSYDSSYAKNPLHIELNTFKDQNYLGFYDIKLNNCYADPSMVREVLAYEICRNYLDAPQSNFAKLYINGKYKGLFTNAESVSNTFLNNHFYSKNGVFVKCNPNLAPSPSVKSNLKYIPGADSTGYYNYYEMKSDYGWTALKALCDTLSNNTSALPKLLDVDRAMWMLALNTLMINLDSYNGAFAQNYYLYKDGTGRFNPIMWDLNMCFGGFPFLGNSNSSLGLLSNTAMQTLPLTIHSGDAYWPLINAVLTNAQYKKMYVAHAKTIVNEMFASGWYLTKLGDYRQLIDSAVYKDNTKFYTYSQFQNALNQAFSVGSYSVPGIVTLMQARVLALQSSSEFTLTAPVISSVGISGTAQLNAPLTITAQVSNAGSSVLMGYRSSKSEAFQRLVMYDDGNHNDAAAGDGLYGCTFTLSAHHTHYYVYAENAQAAGINRQRRVQAELRRKIGYALIGQIRVGFGKPGVFGGHGLAECQHDAVILPQERRIGSRRFEFGLGNLLQEFDRIVVGQFPERFIQVEKKLVCVRVPIPPKVIGKLSQSPDPGRKGAVGYSTHFYLSVFLALPINQSGECGKESIEILFMTRFWDSDQQSADLTGTLLIHLTNRQPLPSLSLKGYTI